MTPGAVESLTFGGEQGGNLRVSLHNSGSTFPKSEAALIAPFTVAPGPLVPTRAWSWQEEGCPPSETRPMAMTALMQGLWTCPILGIPVSE